MAESDFSVYAKLQVDTKNFERNMKRARTSASDLSNVFKNFGASTEKVLGSSGLGKNIPAITKSFAGLTAVIGTEVAVLNKLIKSVTQYSDVYRVQFQSELQLTAAVKNNPLVNGAAVDGLKSFASEMQKVSNYGDEQLLPMMSQLIASGRTEAETQKIIKAAIDLSATGTMSLETAVQQLNATLNGNIGRLGMQNAELKDLTKEELSNGKAIDILAKKYEGLGKAGINTSTQLKNLKGDFQEAIGRFTLPTSELWNKFWAGFYERGINVINKLNDYFETRSSGSFLTNEFYERSKRLYHEGKFEGATNSRQVLEDLNFLSDTVKSMSDEQLVSYQKYIISIGKDAANWQLNTLKFISKEIKNRQIIAIDKQKEAEAAQKAAEQQKTISDIISEAQAKIEKQKIQWESIKQVTGEEVDLEEQIKFFQDNLVSALVESGGQIDENNDFFKEQVGIVEKLYSQLNRPVDNSWVKKITELQIKGLEEYSEKYHDFQLKRINEEQEEALGTAKTEKEKTDIVTYHNLLRQAENERYTKAIEYEEEKRKKETLERMQIITTAIKGITSAGINAAKGVAKGFSTAFKTAGDVVSKFVKVAIDTFKNAFNAIKKMIDFSIDDALDTLLEFEDGVLTFFVETLPRLPQFIESAFNSVISLLNTLENVINFDTLEENLNNIISVVADKLPNAFESAMTIVFNILDTLGKSIENNAPEIVAAFGDMFLTVANALPGIIDTLFDTIGTLLNNLGKYLTNNKSNFENALKNIVKSIIDGISDFIKNDGWKNLLNGLLAVQQAIENTITDNIEEIGNTIISMLPELMEMLKNSIASASKTLGKIAPTLIKVFVEVITEIIDVITSDEVIQSSLEAVEGLIEGLIPGIIKLLTTALPKLIEFFLIKLPSYTPEIIVAIIEGLVNAAINTNWLEVIGDIFSGFVDAFRDFFGIHSPSTLFEGFGNNIVQGLVLGLQGFADAVTTILEPVFDFVENLATGVFDALTNITQISFTGFNQSLQGVANIIDAITRSVVATTEAVTGLVGALNPLSSLTGGSSSTGGGVDIGNVATSVLTGGLVDTNRSFLSNTVSVLTGGLSRLFGFATGSNAVPRGLAVVGEAGPELVNFRGGEQVYNAHNTEKMLKNAGGNTNNFNVTFNNMQDTTAFAMMQQLKAYNRQMAINGVL